MKIPIRMIDHNDTGFYHDKIDICDNCVSKYNDAKIVVPCTSARFTECDEFYKELNNVVISENTIQYDR